MKLRKKTQKRQENVEDAIFDKDDADGNLKEV